ncbi:MAG: cache domain-containing protein, partial [Cyanobacteriota bacterium]
IAVVVFLAIDLHLKSQQKIVAQFNQQQLLHVQTLAATVEASLTARAQGLQVLTTVESVQHFDLATAERHFQEILSYIQAKGVESISLYDSNGVIAFSTNQKAIGRAYKNCSSLQWARALENKGKVYLTGPIHPYSTPPADTSERHSVSAKSPPHRFQLVTPLYREIPARDAADVGSTFIGMVTYTIKLAQLLRYEPGVEVIQANQNLWIIDSSGTLLFQSQHSEMVMKNFRKKGEACRQCHESFDYIDAMLNQKAGTSFYQIKGQPWKVAAYARMEYANASWILVLNVPYDAIALPVAADLKETLLLLGIVIAALAGGSILFYRNYRLKERAAAEARHWREKRELEEKYRNLVDNAIVGVYQTDLEGEILFANDALVETLGFASKQEL